MKLCINCKHYQLQTNRCQSPKLGINMVTGNPYWESATSERYVGWLIARLEGMCGSEGRRFEAK